MTAPLQPSTADAELDAIRVVLSSLAGLDADSRQRVLGYVLNRLNIDARSASMETHVASTAPTVSTEGHSSKVPSIRDLKEEKRPESSNQMAAVVAYYLAEVMEGEQNKESISSSDLEKYFKQAGFKLPKTLAQTLPNAAAAGYLDSLGEGRYKLNPVGYNLVVHELPRSHSTGQAGKRKAAPARRHS